MERRHVSGARDTLAPGAVGPALGARAMRRNAWRAPRAPISNRLSRPSPHRPARVAPTSDEGVEEADPGRASHVPRFARFAAAMDASPAPQDQLFARSPRRIRPPEPVHSVSGIQWLGIGSWAFFCVALFVSLLLPSERASFQLDQIQPRALVSDVRSIAEPTLRGLLPAHGQEVVSRSPTTALELDARPADQGTPARLEAELR
jgi:hypothetical protein